MGEDGGSGALRVDIYPYPPEKRPNELENPHRLATIALRIPPVRTRLEANAYPLFKHPRPPEQIS